MVTKPPRSPTVHHVHVEAIHVHLDPDAAILDAIAAVRKDIQDLRIEQQKLLKLDRATDGLEAAIQADAEGE